MTGAAIATETELQFPDLRIPLAVRVSKRARRITLRIDPDMRGAILVLPRRVSMAEALEFAEEKALWVRNRLAHLPPVYPFVPDGMVPVLGEDCRIVHRPDTRGGVWREGDTIHVTGAAEHLPRRLTDWLRREAKRECSARAHAKAALIDVTVKQVRVRDTRSRWGSCSSAGGLNFSWRLVLAPESVLDYVVAHEVAHLVEMNHSRAFWDLVAQLTETVDEPKAWLKRHGAALHGYGAAQI